MSERGDLVKGWCPGALRPMESGDGLIVRVRPRLSRLSLVQLETLGRAAARSGDGNLYLSNRANVQIRGVNAAGHAAALEMLAAAGLIDSDPRIEAVRNVMLLPAAGSNARAYTALELAAKLEALLAATEALYQLPGKFGTAVQVGNSTSSSSTSDVTFLVQEDRIAMVLEGAPGKAFLFDDTQAAASGFGKIALAFLSLRRGQPAIRRMRDAVSQFGLEAISRLAGLPPAAHDLPFIEAPAPVGDLGEAFGIAFAFGEIGQAALGGITELMTSEGIAEAILTPHRALVFPVTGREKPALQALAGRIGGITGPGDIRLRVHGCPGAPACLRATVPARRDAVAVFEALRTVAMPRGTIHISGCEKRCAYPQGADITAIGAAGRYNITVPSQTRSGVAGAELAAVIADFARAL